MTRDIYDSYGVSEQARASKHRFDDARALRKADRWRGAMYLAGYCIECLLKTKLMRMFSCRHLLDLEQELQRRGDLPVTSTIFTHQLERLLRLTGRLVALQHDETLWRAFNHVNRWTPAWRYSANLASPDEADDFLDAVNTIRQWIENNI